MSQRCQACGDVEETEETTQRVGSSVVTLDTCGNCGSSRLVDDGARKTTLTTEAAR